MDGSSRSNSSAYDSSLFYLDQSRFAPPINGVLMPLIAALTLVNNALVMATLLRRQMRSPTNALLTALAVSDTLTSICPIPCFVHFYTLGRRYLDWVPYSWCFAYFCLTDYLPTVFHTASIWLTTALAVQRYVYVCCPVGSAARRRLCTMRAAVWVVVGVYTAAVASQVCRLGELTFSSVRVPSMMSSTIRDHRDDAAFNGTVLVSACRYAQTAYVARHETVYYNVYYWSRVLLIHVIPCSALVVLNSSLVRTMRAAHTRRRQLTAPHGVSSRRLTDTQSSHSHYEMQLLASPAPPPDTPAPAPTSPDAPSPVCQQGESTRSRCGDSSTRATMMLVIVVGVFLVVEVPLSVLLLCVIVENTFDVDLFSDVTRYRAALVVNCCIAITYPLNFFIYCTMSQRFRQMFRDLLRRSELFDNATAQSSARRSARIEPSEGVHFVLS